MSIVTQSLFGCHYQHIAIDFGVGRIRLGRRRQKSHGISVDVNRAPPEEAIRFENLLLFFRACVCLFVCVSLCPNEEQIKSRRRPIKLPSSQSPPARKKSRNQSNGLADTCIIQAPFYPAQMHLGLLLAGLKESAQMCSDELRCLRVKYARTDLPGGHG